jgi:hypothetical protein
MDYLYVAFYDLQGYSGRISFHKPEGTGSRIYITQEQVAQLYPPALVSLYVVSYDSQGCVEVF